MSRSPWRSFLSDASVSPSEAIWFLRLLTASKDDAEVFSYSETCDSSSAWTFSSSSLTRASSSSSSLATLDAAAAAAFAASASASRPSRSPSRSVSTFSRATLAASIAAAWTLEALSISLACAAVSFFTSASC